jgi:peptidoglycan hydrolase-like protein with peptidoglycan-binding domain
MTSRRPALIACLIGAAAVGAAAAISLTGGQSSPSAPPLPTPATAELSRTTLTASVLTEGTLGYQATAPVINELTGTYTWLPAPGTVVRAGRDLYRVDNQPVFLLAGRVPAWRSFELGMTGGPDVRQLQAALIGEHFAAGLLTTPTGEFTFATAAAVQRWQTARGLAPTGQILLGQVAFLPTAVRVGAWQVFVGAPASPGQQPYVVTTNRRIVTVPVSPAMPAVRVGQRVTVILPSQAPTPGRVTGIGPQTAASGTSAGGTTGTALSVTPLDPGATGTGTGVPVQISLAIQVAGDVLSAPVTALLALAGGGYGVEIVLPTGAHRLVAVRTGLFASGLVQVSGRGLVAGTRVVVAQ